MNPATIDHFNLPILVLFSIVDMVLFTAAGLTTVLVWGMEYDKSEGQSSPVSGSVPIMLWTVFAVFMAITLWSIG